LRAALRSPESFRGVITVGSTAGIEEGPLRAARAEADEKLASWIEAAPIEDIVALWERQPLFADQSDLLVEEQRPGRLAQDPRSLALLLRTAGQGVLEPVWHELSRLELPVLAIAGARDDGYTRAAKRIASTALRGRAAIVEDAGHAPQLQRPEEVARLITGFLDEIA
jgi:2-succinyl-6-hydroxy-2,4-cyclohexadiene-1-carboxylate synthase